MIEILVISGKGGTGKTSLTAAFAQLARDHVICDLDVDAPDMHLLLAPRRIETHAFYSGHQALVREQDCTGCGQCPDWCQFEAIALTGPQALAVVDPLKCEGCKVCVSMCPSDAIDFPERHCGHWYISDTRFGPMVHAQLFPGDENSGRLVALLRKTARDLAEAKGLGLVLSDGPPGIGCPVISSLSGTHLVVIVTEPTLSGSHDLKRVAELCAHFRIPAGVVINKCDINLDQSRRIETYCQKHGLVVFGQVPHDVAMTDAMVKGQVITEYQTDGLAADIQAVWKQIRHHAETAAASQTVDRIE
jgi:MinD superfamily P-loop ATPase